jgi:hypothetical protein
MAHHYNPQSKLVLKEEIKERQNGISNSISAKYQQV